MRKAIILATCALSPFVAFSAAAHAQQSDVTVRVRGIVFDSVSRTPLAGAQVQFVREDGDEGMVATTSSATGSFVVLLPPGSWIAGFTHPRLDSLMIDLPAQRVTVTNGKRLDLRLFIPSSRALLQAFCGRQEEDSAGVLQGFVLRVPERAPLDSGGVYVQWTELQISNAAGLERGMPTIRAHVRPDGSYRACGVPANTEAVAWAQRGDASTGLVGTRIPASGIARLDFSLDPRATQAVAVRYDSSVVDDTTALLEGERLRPLPRTGTARFRGVVRDEAGRVLNRARARVVDRRTVATNDEGAFVLDSLAQGTQTLLVRALGYAQESRIINVMNDTPPDTIRLTSLKTILDTVRVTAERVYRADVTGFEKRRLGGMGHYISSDDIARWKPLEFTRLLWGQPGVRLVYSRGRTSVYMRGMGVGGSTGTSGWCTPAIFIDGFEQVLDYTSDVNYLLQPDELAGVEIYKTPDTTPMEFLGHGGIGCGSIVIWSRARPTPPRRGVRSPQ